MLPSWWRSKMAKIESNIYLFDSIITHVSTMLFEILLTFVLLLFL